jgi:hypothetical protein
MLYTLLYITKPTRSYNNLELFTFFDKLKAWNNSHNITGCLAYIEGIIDDNKQCQFVHVIEGRKQELEGILLKSRFDIRIGETILIKGGFTTQRRFDDWTMGIERIKLLDNPFIKQFFSLNYQLLSEDGDVKTNILMQFMDSFCKDKRVSRFKSIEHYNAVLAANVVA